MRPYRLLLVDDEASILTSIGPTLENEGYRVEATADGQAALDLLRREAFDLILTDIVMAPVDGLELLQAAKKIEPPVMVILLTGYQDKKTAAQALQMGADDYILKPCAPQELSFRVWRCLILQEQEKERRQAEEKARWLTSAVEQCSEGLALVDLQGTVLLTNSAFAEMHGYSAADLVGCNLSLFHLSEHMPRVRRANEQVRKTGQFEGDLWHTRRDGSQFLGHMISSLVKDDQGQPLGVVGMLRDITERRQDEEERLFLERKIQLSRKTESLDRMAGAVAHRFNNLLGVILGNLELSQQYIPRGSEAIHLLEQAREAGNRAADLSNMMLTYLGKFHNRIEPIDLSDLFNKSLPVWRAALPHNISLEARKARPGLVVRGDAGQMHQMLSHLITNAQEAIGDEDGRIDLSLQTCPVEKVPDWRVVPEDWQPDGERYASLEISDTGCGIHESELDNLFDPFYSDKFTGRGLGLPVVLGIVRACQGAIAVRSQPGQGSTFQVLLPLHQVSRKKMVQPFSASLPDIESNLVLLIEDEPMVRRVFRVMLERLGFEVIDCANGQEAIEKFETRQEMVCCAVCDLTMPVMSGWETISALRRIKPELPVILTSGYDEARVRCEQELAEPQVFLKKPYQMDDLKMALEKVLT